MSYTKGPWEAVDGMDNENGVHNHIGIIADGWHIARVWKDGVNPRDDARLIATAPIMLEALKAAVDCGMVPTSSATEGGAAKYGRQVVVADMIRAAIAKAEGRHA